MNTGEINGSVLAYLGDAVMELMTRRTLIEQGGSDVGKMNKTADALVCATAQSAAADHLLPHLTEAEEAVYKRGRNTHSSSVPKRAKVSDYRKATGLEALFGHLYLTGQNERIEELFRLAYAEENGAEQ